MRIRDYGSSSRSGVESVQYAGIYTLELDNVLTLIAIRPPQGSVIPKAFRAFWIGFKSWDMNKAKPSYLAVHGPGHSTVPWNDHFIEELKVALVACQVL
jgi:hypothetical protein